MAGITLYDWMGSMVPVPETATVMSCIAAV